MKNLRKLFYVACAVFFFTSCEETYNDKLFWPGEISQEYGSYIKTIYARPNLQWRETRWKKLSVSRQEIVKRETLTLNDVIPGEKGNSYQSYPTV